MAQLNSPDRMMAALRQYEIKGLKDSMETCGPKIHGETVDNVAGIYAGVRDSALTVHGNLQAERLGKYLVDRGLKFAYIFSSDLQRAFKTAGAIHKAEEAKQPDQEHGRNAVTQLEILREQDFGYYEGKPFYARPRDNKRSGKEEHRTQHQQYPDFKDVETKESMSARMNTFVQDYLIPVLQTEEEEEEYTVAVVSHGIILSHLWRCFLGAFAPNSVSLAPGLPMGRDGPTPLEYLGGWSNTGYLELEVTRNANDSNVSPAQESSSTLLAGHKMNIKAVNGKEHLAGLKRTRGVGSSQHDEGQKNIDAFFKKRKA
ncbi:uncharacterized protein KY384_004557 [Bacidia gigantensis]|uniref:uncharacterized protein n=1 Tax=Bacidia gigantensis TaxID=2732470 RepID=UPI001D05375B|nr:uncharacterized protein KY384_004557 [Bacidia gigantensis]KAG8531199.1 hypothetical protein KY384_004557 [Bacidia gigantensis]